VEGRRTPLSFLAVGLAWTLGACGPSGPDGAGADFVVAVGRETFVLRSTHAETIAQLRDVVAGRRTGFPIGPLRRGDGGFNAPWSWHLDPEETRLTDVAIEVCDGTPSYVEQHVADFPSYCPWGARVTAERR
jgi:hypothetical protein